MEVLNCNKGYIKAGTYKILTLINQSSTMLRGGICVYQWIKQGYIINKTRLGESVVEVLNCNKEYIKAGTYKILTLINQSRAGLRRAVLVCFDKSNEGSQWL